jgi:capsular exopolysaccharide synthesis family protein
MHQDYPSEVLSFDLKEIFGKLVRHWYYYLICGVLIGLLAFAYLQLTDPTYQVSTTLLVEDKTKSSAQANILLQEFNSGFENKNLNNVIGILKSYHLVSKTLESLNFEVSYFEEGLFSKLREQYRSIPFVVLLQPDSFQLRGYPMQVQILDKNQFSITIDEMDHTQLCQFGESCASDYYQLRVRKSFDSVPVDRNYVFKINDLSQMTEKYRAKLKVTPLSSGSTILELTLTDKLPDRAAAFLDRLCETYTRLDLEEKNATASQTIDFINLQLVEVSDSLRKAETQLENFRSAENVMDLSFAASSASERLASLENEKAEIEVRLRYYDYLLNYLQKDSDINTVVAPSSMGITDPVLNDLIIELKKLYNDKVALNYTRSNKSYELNVINLQIENAKNTLTENVNNTINSTRIALKDINARVAEVQAVVNKLPENERDLVRIQRKFNLSDNLYNFLLQKRAEAGIAKASNQPDHQVIDKALIVGGGPIAPKKSLVYLLSLMLLLVVPTATILAKEFLNDKVSSTEQIEKLVKAPIIGKISLNRDKSPNVLNLPHSLAAESFRSLRYNLQYLLHHKEQNVIGITSTVSGEGKTFCSFNLASVLALSQKRIILIEADLRKPQLKKYNPGLRYEFGLSNFLIGRASMEEIIQPTEVPNLDMISSGPIPPNPSELLLSADLNMLIESLKQQYDYVLIDSAPIGMVSDYTSFLSKVDITLYVMRMNYTRANYLSDLQKDYQLGKYKNLGLLVNFYQPTSGKGYNYRNYYYRSNGSEKHLPKLQKQS